MRYMRSGSSAPSFCLMTAAAWTMPSARHSWATARTRAGSRMSASTSRIGGASWRGSIGRILRSSPVTSCPSRAKRAAVNEPTKPQAPVISTRMPFDPPRCPTSSPRSDHGRPENAELLVDLALVGVGPPLDQVVERERAPQPASLERRVVERDVEPRLLAGHLGRLPGRDALAELVVLERD